MDIARLTHAESGLTRRSFVEDGELHFHHIAFGTIASLTLDLGIIYCGPIVQSAANILRPEFLAMIGDIEREIAADFLLKGKTRTLHLQRMNFSSVLVEDGFYRFGIGASHRLFSTAFEVNPIGITGLVANPNHELCLLVIIVAFVANVVAWRSLGGQHHR